MRGKYSREELKAKRYLERSLPLKRLVEAKRRNLEEIETMALPKGIRYDSDKVQMSPENVQEKIMSMYYDASRDYEKVLARFVKVRKEIADVVNSVAEKEPELASILEDRYMKIYSRWKRKKKG